MPNPFSALKSPWTQMPSPSHFRFRLISVSLVGNGNPLTQRQQQEWIWTITTWEQGSFQEWLGTVFRSARVWNMSFLVVGFRREAAAAKGMLFPFLHVHHLTRNLLVPQWWSEIFPTSSGELSLSLSLKNVRLYVLGIILTFLTSGFSSFCVQEWIHWWVSVCLSFVPYTPSVLNMFWTIHAIPVFVPFIYMLVLLVLIYD